MPNTARANRTHRRNLRATLFRQFDEAGLVTNVEYDFKGNLLRTSRQLLLDYRDEVDWAPSPRLEREIFQSETSYDALNRPVTLTAPDRSVIRPVYNDANLLEQLYVSIKGADSAPFVTNIDYNAKGQRELIEYANGAHTTSIYDPLTFRLVHLKTTRASDGAHLQDLTYAYDPVGNVTSIADAAQQTVYFKNQVVSASGNYVYDAVYRLLKADGREHVGNPEHPETNYNDVPRVRLPLPGDGHAMRNYREQYRYDAVGNILEVIHSAANGSWTRHYHYRQIEANDRLTSTSVGQTEDRYEYDPHGNMTQMQHLPSMKWDFKDQLASTQARVVRDAVAETTYYVYDSGGQRVRKVVEADCGRRRAERVYIGGFEIYREYRGDSVSLERTTLQVTDEKRLVALVETCGEETTIRFQFDNHLRSSCVELDDAGAVITYEEYYPYGSTSYQAGRSVAEVSRKRYRFTGKERDEATGLYYHGARYYVPWLGRWSATDPAGLVDGTNIYQYCSSNPTRLHDPSGTQGTCDPSASSCVNQVVNTGNPDDPNNYASGEDFDQEQDRQQTEQFKAALSGAAKNGDLDAATQDFLDQVDHIKEIYDQVMTTPLQEVEGTQPEDSSKDDSGTTPCFSDYTQGVGMPVGDCSGPVAVAETFVGAKFPRAFALLMMAQAKGENDPHLVMGAAAFLPALSAADAFSAGISSTETSGFRVVVQGDRPVLQLPGLNVNMETAGSSVAEGVVPELPAALRNETYAATPGGPIVKSGLDDTAAELWRYSQEAGLPLRPNFRDRFDTFFGTEGGYAATHAEIKTVFGNPAADFVEVSKTPCLGCRAWIRQLAISRQSTLIVLGPRGFYYFTPHGTIFP